jgi:PAS domain S-box-containing protein
MPSVDSTSTYDANELPRLLLEHVPAMLACWDASLHCRFANRAYERWFGVSPEALIGKHISELLGPLYPLNLPHLEAVLRGEPQEFEREIPDPAGGEPRFCLVHYIPHVVEGAVQGLFVLVSDVSDLQKAKVALEESEGRFSGIVSSLPDAIVSVDEEQRIVLFNEGAEAVFGWTKGEMVGRPLDILVPERLRAIHREHVRRFAMGEARAVPVPHGTAEVVGLRKGGEEFPIEGSLSRLQLGGKRLVTASFRDISERKRTEDERKVLLALLDNAPDFIGVADPQGVPIYLNPAGRRMVGLSPDCPIERTQIPEYYAPDQRALAQNVIVPSMLERGRWSGA